ncbi:MAG: phage portal protein [Alphaproteobacteria bacterium]|nr:MAG: phage portal protein [Alphaproteobacteria bacterium]PZO36602.1 MAG: phage portal protein [Alphaproteobacteria bacterium]
MIWPFNRETRNAATIASSDPYLSEWFSLRGQGPGAVNPETLLSNSAVAVRCVNIRSEMLASVGLFLLRRSADGGRARADDLPLYGVLHDLANPQMTAFEAREFLIRSLDLTGNGYARLERDGRGQVIGLYPVRPQDVMVETLPSGRALYRVSQRAGGTITLLQEEMLHVRGPSRDGIMGISAIQYGRLAMSLRVSQAETAKSLIDNGLRPSGVMSYDERIQAADRVKIRESVAERLQGSANAGQLIIMDGGAKYTPLAWSAEDAEFLESQKLSNEDVARLFGVPPTSVGITDKATYSNTEQEARSLVQNCLGPLAARVETAMIRCLLTPDARRTLYIEHDLAALLRGDVQARFEAYRIGREIGALSPNDIRRRENETPIPGGDVYHQPSNWTPLGTIPEAAA